VTSLVNPVLHSYWRGDRLLAYAQLSAISLCFHDRGLETDEYHELFVLLRRSYLPCFYAQPPSMQALVPYVDYNVVSALPLDKLKKKLKRLVYLYPEFPDVYYSLFLVTAQLTQDSSHEAVALSRFVYLFLSHFRGRPDFFYRLFSCARVRHLDPSTGWPSLRLENNYASDESLYALLQRLWLRGASQSLYIAYMEIALSRRACAESDFPLRVFTLLGETQRLSRLFLSVLERYQSSLRTSVISNLLFDALGQEVLPSSLVLNLSEMFRASKSDVAQTKSNPAFERQNAIHISELPVLIVVSPDFRNHPVSRFWLPLARELQSSYKIIHIWLTPETAIGDTITDELKKVSHHWVQMLPLEDASDLIVLMESYTPSIILDLAGHTADARPIWLNHRIAPVQCSYLGFYGPTYASECDWWITDRFLEPYIHNSYPGSERRWVLSCSSLCYLPEIHGLPLPSLGAYSTSKHKVIGSFNHTRKLSREWMRHSAAVLSSARDALLMIRSYSFTEPEVSRWFVQRFLDSGVLPHQVTILPFAKNPVHAMSDYFRINLHLDSYPVSGTTTTLDALGMGIPVVTVPTNLYAGSISAALLNAVGLSDFIVQDPSDLPARAGYLLERYHLPSARLKLSEKIRSTTLFSPRSLPKIMVDELASMLKHSSC